MTRKSKEKQVRMSKKELRKEIKAYVRGESEKNYIDEYADSRIVNDDWKTTPSSALIDLTDAIAQGSGEHSRAGNDITLTQMQVRMSLFRHPNATSANFDNVRIILFKWNADSGEDIPTPGKILYDVSNAFYMSNYEQSVESKRKFKILKDMYFTVGAGEAQAEVTPNNFYRKFTIPGKKLGKVVYREADSIEGTGKIYMMVLGNRTSSSGTQYSYLSYHSMIRFLE